MFQQKMLYSRSPLTTPSPPGTRSTFFMSREQSRQKILSRRSNHSRSQPSLKAPSHIAKQINIFHKQVRTHRNSVRSKLNNIQDLVTELEDEPLKFLSQEEVWNMQKTVSLPRLTTEAAKYDTKMAELNNKDKKLNEMIFEMQDALECLGTENRRQIDCVGEIGNLLDIVAPSLTGAKTKTNSVSKRRQIVASKCLYKDCHQFNLNKKMDTLYRYFYRITFSMRWHINAHPLDIILLQPNRAIKYLSEELQISLIWNLLTIIPSVIFIMKYSSICYNCDLILYSWLCALVYLKIAEIPLKLIVLQQLRVRLQKLKTEGKKFAIRRLMVLIRSNVYYWLTRLTMASYFLYSVGTIRICQTSRWRVEFPTFYTLALSQCFFFLLRTVISFFKFIKESTWADENFTQENVDFLYSGKTLANIESIGSQYVSRSRHIGNIDSKQISCAICTDDLYPDEEVRTLPCNELHIFHIQCIDPWLVKKLKCPLCQKSIIK